DSPVILVLKGLPADPNHPEIAWTALVPLGPGPSEPTQTSLVKTSEGMHPTVVFVPLLVLGGAALLTAGAATAAAFFGGKALVDTGKVLSQSQAQSITKSAQDAMVASELLSRTNTVEKAQSDLENKSKNAQDNS